MLHILGLRTVVIHVIKSNLFLRCRRTLIGFFAQRVEGEAHVYHPLLPLSSLALAYLGVFICVRLLGCSPNDLCIMYVVCVKILWCCTIV